MKSWDFFGKEWQRSGSHADQATLTKRLNAAIDDKKGQLRHCIGMASLMPSILDGLMVRMVELEEHAPDYEQVRDYVHKFLQECGKISERVHALAAELDDLKRDQRMADS